MRRFVVLLTAVAVSAGACTDNPAFAPPDGPARSVTTSSGTSIGTYWRTSDTLWVYDTTPEVGIGTHFTSSTAFTQIRNAGMRIARVGLYWDPQYTDAALSNIVNLSQQHGVVPLVVVHHVGQCREWYTDPYQAFADFMADAASRYPSIQFWQLWNEQDAPGWTNFFGGTGSPSCQSGSLSVKQQGEQYAAMLQRVYPAMKAANPNTYVVVGGLTGWGGWEFLHGIYTGGGRQYFDYMAIHTYGAAPDEPVRQRGQAVRSIMNGHDDAGRPMWVTEFGTGAESFNLAWGTPHTHNPPLDDATTYDEYQRSWWQEALDINTTHRLYTKMLGYQLYATDGGAEAGCRPDNSFCWPAPQLPAGLTVADFTLGILRSDNATPRPTYTWLQQRNYNGPVNTGWRSEWVWIYSPDKDPISHSFTRYGDSVEIQWVAVNSLTPTPVLFGPRNDDPPNCFPYIICPEEPY